MEDKHRWRELFARKEKGTISKEELREMEDLDKKLEDERLIREMERDREIRRIQKENDWIDKCW